MGSICSCSQNQLETDKKEQFDYADILNNGTNYILPKILEKCEKYNNIEFISKEDFDDLLQSFPNSINLINEFKLNFEDNNTIKGDITRLNSNPMPDTELNNQKLIEIKFPIKLIGDNDEYSIYNFNINNNYEFTGKGYQITSKFLYYGSMKNNKYNGKGIMIKNNGNYISSDWIDGFCYGKGILKIQGYFEYEGDFVNNKKEGYGIEKYKDGSLYEGEFKNNQKNGKGKFVHISGENYEGEFKDDLYEGEGCYKWPSESREYIGHFFKGNMEGKGKNKYSDGSIFEGNYRNGLKYGYGIYTWPNGKKYQGNWVNNKLHGNGFFEIDNKKYNVTFRFGKIISAKENIDINNIIKFGIENIVNKDEKNLDKYACSECNKLLYHPQKCMKCSKNYCSDCIKINNEKNKKCKFCDGNEFETNAALVFDLINNIKVYCDICKKELNYESALNHVHQ